MQAINTALLSYGMSGKVFHAPFINLHEGFHLLGAWERSKKLIQDAYPGTHSYASLDELLADDAVELVVVNTPTYTHYEYTKRALEAGKACRCRKGLYFDDCRGGRAETTGPINKARSWPFTRIAVGTATF